MHLLRGPRHRNAHPSWSLYTLAAVPKNRLVFSCLSSLLKKTDPEKMKVLAAELERLLILEGRIKRQIEEKPRSCEWGLDLRRWMSWGEDQPWCFT